VIRFMRLVQITLFCALAWLLFGGVSYLIGSAILAAVRS